jgi:hypothetical protein
MCVNKWYIHIEKRTKTEARTDSNSVKNTDPPSPYACTIIFTLTSLFYSDNGNSRFLENTCITIYITTRYHIPEVNSSHSHYCENRKSHFAITRFPFTHKWACMNNVETVYQTCPLYADWVHQMCPSKSGEISINFHI